MPLYGRKIHNIVPPLNDVKPGEDIYTIEYTGEQFRSHSEYEKRLESYQEKVWTCQCTGHINLTHEQAWNSEKEKMDLLERQFPEYFEKPVLEIVHHNTTILDDLVDQTWTRLQQVLAVREPVALKVKSGGKEITGVVTRLDSTCIEPNGDVMVNGASDGECNSPSSDKENKTLNEEVANSSFDGSPAKWQPPRLLPYKYSITLDEGDKVISGIPASDIKRLKRTPTKELVKLFIRSMSHRPGLSANSPWIVKDELVKKFSLPSKFADIFMSPKASKSEGGKKRKSSLTPNEPAKKRKTDSKPKSLQKQSVLKPNTSSNSPRKSPKKAATPKKGTPSKPKTPLKVVEVSDGSDTSDSDSDASSDSSAEDEMPLSDIKMGKSPTSSPKKKTLADLKRELAKSPSKSPKKQSLADLKKILQKNDKKTAEKKGKGSKSAGGATKKRGRPSQEGSSQSKKSKKNMKQATLFEMKGKKSGGGSKSNTPKKNASPRKQTPVKLPPIVTKLQKEFKKANNKAVCSQLIAKCAKVLSARMRAALPEDIKEVVLKKFEQIAEKKKMESMTAEEKEEYLRNKRKEIAKKVQEKKLQQNKRYEDQDLKLAPLPLPKLVPTPDGLPNELFGEVAMVTQFISCYKELLMPDEESPIMTDVLMKALVADKTGFTYLAKTLEVLMQTLLQDAIAEEYSELSVPLKSVTVTKWNVSEMVRLCLRKHDADENRSMDSNDSSLTGEEDEVEEDLIEKLEIEEIFSLRTEEKLRILTGLCHRIMSSYSVQDFMEQKQREAAELWKTKIRELKKKNDRLKQEREKRKSGGKGKGRPSKKEEEEEKQEEMKKKNMKNMTITNFYGANSADNSATESDGDITSVLKSRRVAAARAAEDRARRDRDNLMRRAKETEEQKMEREKELFEKRYTAGLALAKLVYRNVPIGTDRNHNRYWVFHKATPGLYIEKGWAPKEIDYCVQTKMSEKEASTEDETASPSKKKGRPKKSDIADTERTFPHTGQNLWFAYDNVKDLEQLVQNLNSQGIRESALKSELQKQYPDISLAVITSQSESQESEGEDDDLVEGLRKELMAMESGLRHGGLGGVDNYTDWEKNIKTAKTIKEFGALLTETLKFISEKFRTGILAPIKQKLKVEVKKEGGEEDEVEVEFHEETIYEHDKVVNLREAIEECPTFSRMHFLLSIVDASIKWEKSAENAKCKICRKKRDEDSLLLCDECNHAFHMHCLRPALPEVPTGDWFCPSCRPLTQRKCRREVTDYKKLDQGTAVDSSDEEDESDKESESDGELVHEETCTVCGGDEGLINCSTCVSCFHMDCHDPPLMREPRAGTWKCMQCKSGVRLHTRNRRKAAENRKRWLKEQSESEEEEEEEEESDDETIDEGDESEEEKTPTRSSPRRSTVTSRSSRRQSQESDSDSLSEYLSSNRRSSTRRSQESGIDDKTKEMKTVMDIVSRVTRHKSSWPFREPVNADDVPDYYDIVTNPIDLLAMKEKCADKMYKDVQEFVDDMALLFDNGDLYNKPDSIVGKCIPTLESYAKDLLTKHLPSYKYQRNYNRATMKSLEAHGYSDHAYC